MSDSSGRASSGVGVGTPLSYPGASAPQKETSRSYGFIVWFILILFLILAIFYVAWYLFQRQMKRYLQMWWKQQERQSQSSFHHHSQQPSAVIDQPGTTDSLSTTTSTDLHVKEDMMTGGNLAVAGTGTFRDGLVVGEIGGFRGQSVHVVDPLVATGGFHLAVQNLYELKFTIAQSRFYRCLNASGNAMEGTLPPVKSVSGAVMVIKNESAFTSVKITTQGTDTINQSQNHILIPTFAILISNGDSDWLAMVE